MLTPAIRASRTSEPPVIISNARATHVRLPPFVNLLPFADEMTTGLTLFGVITVGAWPNSDLGVAAATPATPAVVRTKSRRFSFFMMASSTGPRRSNAETAEIAEDEDDQHRVHGDHGEFGAT